VQAFWGLWDKEGLVFGGENKDPFQLLMLNQLSSIAQFERDLLLERQREGISIAKAKGKCLGKQSRFSEADVARIREEFSTSDNKQKLADRCMGSPEAIFTTCLKYEKAKMVRVQANRSSFYAIA
jgi:DNA invertase Pin-like site-specific DNA recombinase